MKIIYKLVLVAILLTASSTIYSQEHCISEKLNTNMTGVWTGEDSYSLVFRKDLKGRTCVKLVEADSPILRKIRDIVIVKGEIRHLTYYTPSTDGYVAHLNINTKGNEMKFYWFSSYQNLHGEDTYVRQPSTKPKTKSK